MFFNFPKFVIFENLSILDLAPVEGFNLDSYDKQAFSVAASGIRRQSSRGSLIPSSRQILPRDAGIPVYIMLSSYITHKGNQLPTAFDQRDVELMTTTITNASALLEFISLLVTIVSRRLSRYKIQASLNKNFLITVLKVSSAHAFLASDGNMWLSVGDNLLLNNS